MKHSGAAFVLRAECHKCGREQFYPKEGDAWNKNEAALMVEMHKDGWIVKPISKGHTQFTCKNCKENSTHVTNL